MKQSLPVFIKSTIAWVVAIVAMLQLEEGV